MIEVIDAKNFVSTKTITAVDSDGNTIEVVSLYGGVELDHTTSFSFNILNKDVYNLNRVAIQEQVDLFIDELKAKIKELGGLCF